MHAYCFSTAVIVSTIQPNTPVHYKQNATNVVALNCSAVGAGNIHYTWERYHSPNNSWIRPSQRVVNATSPQLIFSVIMEEDNGTYRCIATNHDGNAISNATIFVHGQYLNILTLQLLYCVAWLRKSNATHKT